MATWYECKVKYMKADDQGKHKMVTESYLVDAISFTEAEARINEEISQYVKEFKVVNIRLANFSEIHPFEDADIWYKCKVGIVVFDDVREKETVTNCFMLVQADAIKEALENIEKVMSNTMADYRISSITETAILEVYPYFSGEEEELNKIPDGFKKVKSEEE